GCCSDPRCRWRCR
nr:Chain A, Alpha-conotoxin RgIA [synthetic construct]